MRGKKAKGLRKAVGYNKVFESINNYSGIYKKTVNGGVNIYQLVHPDSKREVYQKLKKDGDFSDVWS